MNSITLMTFILSALTLLVSLTSAILTYRLQRSKKRIERLEKHYLIAIENLQVCYEIEEYYAGLMNKSRNQIQYDLRLWMEDKNIDLKRDYYRPSYLKAELDYLRK